MTPGGATSATAAGAPEATPAAFASSLEERARSLRATALRVVREALGDGAARPYALLDFPCFENVGDNAIWLGTRTLLEDLGLPPPAYTCDNRTFEPEVLSARVGDGPVLLLGGGNFGDLFGKHQRLRERVVTELPRNPVLQLPQTIHFRSEASRAAARRIFSRRPRLKVLVRDARSLETARKDLDLDATLCPDLALGLGVRPPPRPPRRPIVWLARGDAWSLHPPEALAEGVPVSDWPRERPTWLRARVRFLSSLLRRRRSLGLPVRGALSRLYDPLARWRVERGLAHVGRASVLVTDRLHGHLLAMCTGTPHVLLDDATGKIRAFHDTWSRGLAGVRWASGAAEALSLARALRDQVPSAGGGRR